MATTAQAKAAAERAVVDRYAGRLFKAFAAKSPGVDQIVIDNWARFQLDVLKASAAALFPGQQKRKHLIPALGKMVTASCRVIRRSRG